MRTKKSQKKKKNGTQTPKRDSKIDVKGTIISSDETELTAKGRKSEKEKSNEKKRKIKQLELQEEEKEKEGQDLHFKKKKETIENGIPHELKKETRSFMHLLNANEFYEPYAIKRMALNSDETLLAVAHINSDIEIWKTPKALDHPKKSKITESMMNTQWTLIKRIPAKKNTSVESIVWVKTKCLDRLFTAGMHGYITEWDLDTLLPKNTSGVYGGAIWSLAVHNKTLAAACEDGNIRLYNLDLMLKQSFGPSKAETVPKVAKLSHCDGHRLMAICFNNDGSLIYCGGLTGVYCFEVKNGELRFKITLSSSICMSLCYLKDNTLIVGDSSGQTMFCDGTFGTIHSLHKQHLADILQIVPSRDESKVFVAGVDPKISMFQKGTKANQWVHTHGKNPHNHDVFALALFDDSFVLSGGIDARISFTDISDYYNREETRTQLYGLIPANNIAYARNIELPNGQEERFLFLSDNRNVISVFQLPSKPRVVNEQPSNGEPKYDKEVPSNNEDSAQSLLSQLLTASKGGWILSSFSISPDGKSVCCCGADFAIIFKLSFTMDENDNVQLNVIDKYDMKAMDVVPGLHCAFINNQVVVIASRTNNTLQLFNIDKKQLIRNYIMKSLDDSGSQSSYFANSVHSLCANDKYVIVARGYEILVYDVMSNDLSPYWSISLVSSTDSVVYKVDFLTHEPSSFYTLSTHNKVTLYRLPDKSIIQDVIVKRKNEKELRGGVRALVQGETALHAYSNYAMFELEDQSFYQHEKGISQQDEYLIMSVLPLSKQEYVQLRFDYLQFYLSLIGVVYRKRYGT
jgi:outer membrane protein assembly factor BamB